jgi:hypothetical protein
VEFCLFVLVYIVVSGLEAQKKRFLLKVKRHLPALCSVFHVSIDQYLGGCFEVHKAQSRLLQKLA